MRNYYEVLKIDPTANSEEIIRSLELERNLYNQQTNISKPEIDLIIKQLEEVENTLLDPIKRTEYNRKLKKEQRNRRYQEQIAKEQEELRSFVENDLSKVQSQTTEVLILENDCAFDKQPLDRETEIESSDRIIKEEVSSHSEDRREQETVIVNKPTQTSATTSFTSEPISSKVSSSSDWLKAIVTGVVMGVFVLVGSIALKPKDIQQQTVQTPTKTSPETSNQSSSQKATLLNESSESLSTSASTSSTQEDFTQEDAVRLIEKWQNAKREIFAPPFNRQLGVELLTGKAYYDNIGKPDGSIGWLENNYSHYTYGVQKIESVENFEKNGNYATIDAVITEQRTLHNSNGGIDRNASGFDTRLVRYNLRSENGQWKIAEYRTVRKIKTR